MHKAATRSIKRLALRPLAAAAAAALLVTAGIPVQAQSFTQSGANSTAPNNYLPFNEALLPTSLNFGNDTIYIANSAPGSFSALSGAQLTAGALSIANGGVSGPSGSVGDVIFSGAGTSVQLGGSTNRLEVGNWGTGTLTVSGGALLDASLNYAACGSGCNSFIGNAAGSTGTLNITGPGSEVRAVRGFVVGAAAVFTQAQGGFTFGTPGGTTNAFVNVLAGGTLRTEQATVGNGPNNAGATGTEKAFGTVVIDGVGSKWVVLDIGLTNIAAGLTIGNRVGGDGKVTVSGGGKLELDGAGGPSAGGFINIGSNNGKGSLTVTGSGSSVDVFGSSGVIQVGRSGASAEGSFSVLAGGAASAVFMNVGRDGAKGNVVIDGAGSLVTMAGLGRWATGEIGGSAVTIGWNGGNGEVTVSDGGRLRVTDGGVNTSTSAGSSAINVGYIGGTGKLSISGANSAVEIVTTSINPAAGVADNFNPFMAIGRDAGGTGELAISAGGKLLLQGNALSTLTFGRGTSLQIGGYSDTVLSGNGTATVTGQYSELRVEGADAFIAVGRNGSGSLTLNDKALLATTIMNVGRAGSGDGTLTVNNSFIELSGQFTSAAFGAGLTLGNRGGTGVATITNNSLVTITNLASAGASLNLGGTSTNPLGHGELTLNGGSKINFVTAAGLATMTVGRDGSGIATISGSGSQIDLGTGALNVGQLATGTGALTIGGGGKVLAGIVGIGGSSDTVVGGIGSALVTGLGSELKASGATAFIGVGRNGGGTLTVTDQAKVSAIALGIGRTGGIGGVLSATNATIELAGQQTTGNLAGANLSIGNGGGTGTATLLNSTVSVTNLGSAGAGMHIGGSGNFPLGSGTLSMANSQITVTAAAGLGNVHVGRSGTGVATLDNSSITNAGGRLYVGRDVGSTGTLTLTNGSTVTAANVGVGVSSFGTGGAAGGTGTLNLTNSAVHTGRLEVGAGGTVNVNAGGTLNVSSLGSAGASPVIDSSVYVARQTGATGTMIVGSLLTPGAVVNADFVGIGVNAKFAGGQQSNGGAATLVLNNSTINTKHFELGAGSLLTGDGGVINAGPSGPVIIGGTISPGNSPGRLRINCDLTMLLGSQLILEIDQDGANFEIDQLIIGSESVFDLKSLQIIFSFIGDTDPNAFARSPGGFNLDKFLKAGNGTNEDEGLSSLFGTNPNGTKKNWDAYIDSEMFAFESPAYDVTQLGFNPNTGQVVVAAAAIPEPASIALVLLALATMMALSRRRAARRV